MWEGTVARVIFIVLDAMLVIVGGIAGYTIGYVDCPSIIASAQPELPSLTIAVKREPIIPQFLLVPLDISQGSFEPIEIKETKPAVNEPVIQPKDAEILRKAEPEHNICAPGRKVTFWYHGVQRWKCVY
jgi:hypothetical protein